MISGIILSTQIVNAQRVALKSNLIDWATLSPNLAMEVRLNQKFTLDISATTHPFSFTIADIKATHFRLQPELRYWFNRPMARHFVGVGLLGGLYNLRVKEHFYEGDIWGGGDYLWVCFCAEPPLEHGGDPRSGYGSGESF